MVGGRQPGSAFWFALAIFGASALAEAQPPFGGGPPGGGSSGGWRGPDPNEIVERLDDNHNGQVDLDEMEGRSRFFLEMLARDNGLDLSKPIGNDKLRDMLKARFSGGSGGQSNGNSSGSRSSSPAVATPGVPGFGTTITAAKVPGFGLDAVIESWDSLKARYGDRVVDEVQDAMRRYDKNNDGILDAEELKNGQWRSDPREYDKNRDGKLTRGEMAERYKARSSGGSSSGGGSYGGGSYGGYRGGPPGGYGSGGYGGGPPQTSVATATPSSTSSSGTSNNGSGSSGSSRSSNSGSPAGTSTSGSSPTTSPVSKSTSSNSSSGGASSAGVEAQYADFAAKMIKQYDANNDGVLQRDEWGQLKPERQKADTDNNGVITKEELTRNLIDYSRSKSGGSSSSGSSSSGSSNGSSSGGSRSGSSRSYGNSGGSTSGGSRKTYRFLAPVERLPKGLPDWFIRSDADGDGQVAMAEFSSSWNDAKAAEFAGWDHNGDGLITPKEALVPRP